ncbi:hypothetical protein BACFIN_08458 [Bacteroides finegoldii DSM 17565]|nr:hypothetical protein BACFIN_08458 [Bacteroides finegoldii DSM 17565]
MLFFQIISNIFYIYDAKTLWGTWIQIEENNHHWVWKFEPNGDFY